MGLILRILLLALSVYEVILLARVIFSWIPGGGSQTMEKFRELSFTLTEPLLLPIRNFLFKTPLANFGIDLSPIALFLLIGFARNLIYGIFR